MKKAALHNLGCKVNSYEAEAMQQMLEKDGYEIVPFEEKADVYIINTCSVTNMADRKSRQMIHKAKKRNPNAIVVAAGCYVQAAKDALTADPAIDILIGNNQKINLIEEIHAFQGEIAAKVIDIASEKTYEELSIDKTAEHTRAYIKVQDGCNQFCSYCIIPYTRGRVRSRKESNILAEVLRLTEAGYKEFVLTGIHLSSYGIDISKDEREDYLTKGAGELLQLIKKVSEIEGVERIRLGSLEPRIVTDKFAEELSEIKKVCPHFHLSLQSGSDTVLKRMNRHYTSQLYLEKCEILRKYFGNPAFTTDIIVGFPGETEEEFQETYDFVKKIGFYETHIFKYSIRKGTRAETLPDQVPESVKTRRSNEMLELGKINKKRFEDAFAEHKVELLIEEQIDIDDQSWQIGHTREYIKVGIRSNENLKNQIICGKLGEDIRLM